MPRWVLGEVVSKKISLIWFIYKQYGFEEVAEYWHHDQNQ